MADFKWSDLDSKQNKPNNNQNNPFGLRGENDIIGIWTWIRLNLIIFIFALIPYYGLYFDVMVLFGVAFSESNMNIKNWAKALLTILMVVLLVMIFIFNTYVIPGILVLIK